MGEQKPALKFYVWIIITTVVAVVGGVLSYSGLPTGQWLEWLTLGVLMVYFHTFKVNIGQRMSYSLSTATIFPIIYLFGTTPAMIMSAVSGLIDGILGKKSWERIAFNASQLAICSLVGSLVFQGLGGTLNPITFQTILAMGISTLAYVLSNILIVTFLIAVYTETSWWQRIGTIGFSGLYSSIGNSFIGLIFTFFIASYDFWGLIAYALLLIHLSELLKAAAKISGERERRRELEEELEIDEMTKAFNFRFLNRWLNDPNSEKVGVLFLDIDDFKVFNDHYGHAEGDVVLKVLTETITKNIRADDKVVRYGGDEFVVLLPNMNKDGAKRVAKRIQDSLRKLPFASREHPITVSIGIASAPHDTTDKHQLLFIADQAMYEAKRSGKNTFCVYQSQQGPA